MKTLIRTLLIGLAGSLAGFAQGSCNGYVVSLPAHEQLESPLQQAGFLLQGEKLYSPCLDDEPSAQRLRAQLSLAFDISEDDLGLALSSAAHRAKAKQLHQERWQFTFQLYQTEDIDELQRFIARNQVQQLFCHRSQSLWQVSYARFSNAADAIRFEPRLKAQFSQASLLSLPAKALLPCAEALTQYYEKPQTARVQSVAAMMNKASVPMSVAQRSEHQYTHTLQLATLSRDSSVQRFLKRHADNAFYCQGKENGATSLYFGRYSSNQEAQDAVSYYAERFNVKPLVTRLAQLSLAPCRSHL